MVKSKSPFGENKSPNGDNQVKSTALIEFGVRLRNTAQDRGLNQRLLAQSLSIPTSTIGRYWHGQRLLPADLLFRAADSLSVDARWLATGENSDHNALSNQEKALLVRFKELSLAQQNHVIDTADLLVGAPGPVLGKVTIDTSNTTLHSPRSEYRARQKES